MIGALLFIAIFFGLVIILYATYEPAPQLGYPAETLKGEEVKSQAERTIADYFFVNGIKYEYEYKIRGIGSSDFYLPDYDVFVEYWGLVNADDEGLKNRYVRNMRWKMAQYYSRNIKFISIYPWNLLNLDVIFRSKFKQVTGKELH